MSARTGLSGQPWCDLGVIMADRVHPSQTVRIQLCGRLAVEVDGCRIESSLPGRQGRLLLAYLTLARHEPKPRSELISALWPAGAPDAADTAVNALLSKLRSVLGGEMIAGRGPVQLVLPSDTRVDLEVAVEAIHRAESAYALGDWSRSWAAAQTSMFIARRGFLPEESFEWAEVVRRQLAEVYRRALETYAGAALRLGSTELPTAERACRELVALAPYRESGHRLLMETLVAQGNAAEALLAYDGLVRLLREELGVAPSVDTRALHERILDVTA
jgi:SARP family transcriptional regulator, regulator of embCAB operon